MSEGEDLKEETLDDDYVKSIAMMLFDVHTNYLVSKDMAETTRYENLTPEQREGYHVMAREVARFVDRTMEMLKDDVVEELRERLKKQGIDLDADNRKKIILPN